MAALDGSWRKMDWHNLNIAADRTGWHWFGVIDPAGTELPFFGLSLLLPGAGCVCQLVTVTAITLCHHSARAHVNECDCVPCSNKALLSKTERKNNNNVQIPIVIERFFPRLHLNPSCCKSYTLDLSLCLSL